MRPIISTRIFAIYFVAALLSGIVIFSACDRDEPEEKDETTILNLWIWGVMNDIYLWADEIDPSLYPDNEPDPEAFFYKLRNEKDQFSWIVDDIEELEASFAGIELSNGISPGWVLISGTDQVIAVVEFVYENSPAADSGIQRGDIILEVNGETMNRYNYYSRFYQQNASYSLAEATPSGLVLTGETITLEAKVMDLNPVQHHEVIEYEGKKIGYLVYTQFTAGEGQVWLQELDAALESFKLESVSDVIIDIRYNPGGSVGIAEHIAASLVPLSNVNNRDVFTRFVWNDEYNEYFLKADFDEDGQPDGEDSEWLVVKFNETAYNLGLTNVYILTSFRSASACELLITGVEAYNNVIHVGDTTRGKFYGSITIGDTEDPPRHTWGMQPLVFKYANANGFTDFIDGLFPDYPMRDDLVNAVPFGDLRDPMLATALEQITGVSPPVKKSARFTLPYSDLPDPRKDYLQRSLRLERTFPERK